MLLKRVDICVITLLAQIFCSSSAWADKTGEWFTLIHTNDILSHFDETGSSECPHAGSCFGGISRLVHLVKEEKNKGNNVLVVDAGNMFNTQLLHRPSAEKLIKELVSLVGYDVVNTAFMEYAGGAQRLDEYISWYDNAKPSVVCTDLHYSLNNKEATRCKRWAVVQVGGLRVGFVSGMGHGLVSLLTDYNVSDIGIDENPRTYKKHLNYLYNEEKVDLVISMITVGPDVSQELLSELSFAEIFMVALRKGLYWSQPGGGTGEQPAKVGPYGEIVNHRYPYMVSHSKRTAYVLTAASNLLYAGLIRFRVESKKITGYRANNPVILNGDKDLEAEKVMKRLRPEQEAFLGGTIGQSAYFIDAGRRCRIDECVVGNLLTDAMLESAGEPNRVHGDGPLIGWSNVNFALINGNNLQSISKGPIHREDAFQAYAFSDKMVLLDIKGQQLLDTLQMTARELHNPEKSELLQLSGIKMTIDTNKPIGKQVSAVSILCSVCIVPTYRNVDVIHTYRVVTTDYCHSSFIKKGYFKNAHLVKTLNHTVQQSLEQFIERHTPLVLSTEHRMQIIHKAADDVSKNHHD